MRLIATLLVRDEADVIAATIEHHLAQGVDLIVATDNGSVDSTTEILEQYAAAGLVDVIHEPDHTYRQAEWVTRMARRAAVTHGADWVINLDADEFWLPTDRTQVLTQVLSRVPAECTVVVAHRTDLIGPRLARGPWPRRLRWRNLQTVSDRGTALAPKVCHRADADVVVAQGNHSVGGIDAVVLPTEPFDIYHVPVRSWPQFRRKIENGGSSYAANRALDAEVGWHWRADYERLQAGSLEKTYRDRQPSLADLVSQVRSGAVVRDSHLLRGLEALQQRAVRPDLLRRVLVGESGGLESDGAGAGPRSVAQR